MTSSVKPDVSVTMAPSATTAAPPTTPEESEEESEEKLGCDVKGTKIEEGEVIQTADPCMFCKCAYGEMVCAERICDIPQPDCVPVGKKAEQCCAEAYKCPTEDGREEMVTFKPPIYKFTTVAPTTMGVILGENVTTTPVPPQTVTPFVFGLETKPPATQPPVKDLATGEPDLTTPLFTTLKPTVETTKPLVTTAVPETGATETAESEVTSSPVTPEASTAVPTTKPTLPPEAETPSAETEVPGTTTEGVLPTTKAPEVEATSQPAEPTSPAAETPGVTTEASTGAPTSQETTESGATEAPSATTGLPGVPGESRTPLVHYTTTTEASTLELTTGTRVALEETTPRPETTAPPSNATTQPPEGVEGRKDVPSSTEVPSTTETPSMLTTIIEFFTGSTPATEEVRPNVTTVPSVFNETTPAVISTEVSPEEAITTPAPEVASGSTSTEASAAPTTPSVELATTEKEAVPETTPHAPVTTATKPTEVTTTPYPVPETTPVKPETETTPAGPELPREEEVTTTSIPVTHEPEQTTTEEGTEGPIIIEEGSCIFDAKVYQSAEQIPRPDPCDFCFCFRGDIICLQQTCPPPIPQCFETPISGFCCPRYECPVHMSVKNVSMTTTTTTTTTTPAPRFGAQTLETSMEVKGCDINGNFYQVGQVVKKASGPCLECICDASGMIKCNPKECQPQAPLLLRMNRSYFRTR